MRRQYTPTAFALFAAIAFAAVISLILPWSTAAEDAFTPDDVKGPLTWGSATRVTQLSRLFFADQPDAIGIDAARAAGVEVVINMRAPSEIDWDEKAAVEKAGIEYYNVEVSGPTFDRNQFERIESLVASNPNEKILIHCGSSNRAGGWLATHLVTRHGMSEDEALEVGRRAGITKQAIEKRVRDYLAAPRVEGASR